MIIDINDNKFKCKFCGKELNKLNGLRTHEFWCNPNNLKKEETRDKFKRKRISNETKRKMSNAKIGNKNGVGNKNMMGKHHSNETKKKISESVKKTFQNSEIRNKMSIHCTKMWQNPNSKVNSIEFRKKRSENAKKQWQNEEYRKKMTEIKKRLIQDPEYHKKLSSSMKGRQFTEEHRKNLSESKKGTYHSDKTKEEMSERMKNDWKDLKFRTKMMEIFNKTETRLKHSEKMKNAWKDPNSKYNSDECKQKMSKLHKGEKSHLWKGGMSKGRKKQDWKWTKAKRLIYERDKCICQKCKQLVIFSKNKYDLKFPNVHHLINRIWCEKNRIDFYYTLGNIVLLCRNCHISFVHSNKNINNEFILKPTPENIKKVEENSHSLTKFL